MHSIILKLASFLKISSSQQDTGTTGYDVCQHAKLGSIVSHDINVLTVLSYFPVLQCPVQLSNMLVILVNSLILIFTYVITVHFPLSI